MKKLIVSLAAVASLLIISNFSLAAEDGATLYKARCAGCHGADGAKESGTMKALKGMSADNVHKALEGYAAKTFGGEKKMIMEKIVAKLSPEDMKALADQIATFK